MTVLIAGGGIAGLTLGLTLHQIGHPFHIYERVSAPKPLGVGINLQPPAVRELFALGLERVLNDIGVQTRDYGFYTRTGIEIWTEPRGTAAGYAWPQFSVHRGRLQMALLKDLLAKCGPDCITFGARIRDYGVGTLRYECAGETHSRHGALVVGADGIHSAIRTQMYPEEGAPVWGGAIMWRGTSIARPFLSGASMILAGNDTQRFVAYPISAPDPATGLATLNWIAEKTVDPATHIEKEDWSRQVDARRFDADFADWDFGWINAPDLIRRAEAIFEYPMIDREPVSSWTKDCATLIGDAAHATYPVGSSGASQAILDARHLGAAIAQHGPTVEAAHAYEEKVRPVANAVTLANRGQGGPDAIMQIAEDRCEGDFSKLDDVLPMHERENHAERFKSLAGLSVAQTNCQPRILASL